MKMLNILKKIARKNSSTTDDETSLSEVENIVQAYAAAMQNSAIGSLFKNENDLPYPKEKIKKALITAIKMTEDQGMKEQLKSAYVMLADWQRGIDEKTLLGFAQVDPDLVSPQDILEKLKNEKHWSKIVAGEAENLLTDIKDL